MGRLSVWNVDDEVLNAFKEFVIQKHQKLHKALSVEVTNALKEYLQNRKINEGTHTHFPGKVVREIPELKKAILEKVEMGGSVPKSMVANIVRQVSGVTDKRPIENRINALVADGFLTRNWEVSPEGNVFKVVGNAQSNDIR